MVKLELFVVKERQGYHAGGYHAGILLAIIMALGSGQPVLAARMQGPGNDQQVFSEDRVLAWPRLRPKVIYWRALGSAEDRSLGGRFEGVVTRVAGWHGTDGSYHVTVSLKEDSGQEVSVEFWDVRGFNQSLANYQRYLGEAISILLTHKFYSISGPQR